MVAVFSIYDLLNAFKTYEVRLLELEVLTLSFIAKIVMDMTGKVLVSTSFAIL